MSVKNKNISSITIELQKGQSVFLTILIGNAQIGGSILKFTDEEVLFAKGTISVLLLGKADMLDGRTLRVITNVLDANTSTNKMVVLDEFRNGDPAAFEYQDEVEEEGDIFSLKREYKFKTSG